MEVDKNLEYRKQQAVAISKVERVRIKVKRPGTPLWTLIRWRETPSHHYPLKNYQSRSFTVSLKASTQLYILLFTMNVLCVCCSVVPDSLWPHGLQPTRLLCPWNFPGKNTGADYHFLLQGIFSTQGSNLHLFCLLNRQANSSPLCHLGNP